MRGLGWIVAMMLGCAACSGDDDDAQAQDAMQVAMPERDAMVVKDAMTAADAISRNDASDADAMIPAEPNDDAGTVPATDPCSLAALRSPTAANIYYVAIDEPGADDSACDGQSPRDEGDGHCPFKHLDAERVRALLDQAASNRVEVRAGTYVIHGWDGLHVSGRGTSEDQRIVLSAFPGEHPVLDVPSPNGTSCTTADAMTSPDCVRQVIRISGTYTQVQGLTIHNGLGYHVEITGGAHHVFACNTLGETVAFAMRSDQLKLDAKASDIQIRHNDFSHFRSQAIDVTGVSDVLIEDNEFHDPIDDDAGAVGMKFGARDVTIRGNRIHDFGSSAKMHAFSLGGTGSGHPDDREAHALHLIGNRIWNIAGILAQVVSCADCTIEDNDLSNAGAGVLVSASGTGGDDCEASANGCAANQGTRITGNRMRALDGGGDAAQANVFVMVEPGEEAGLFAGENLYCASEARFGWSGDLLDHDAFVAASGTDESSSVHDASDDPCTEF